MSVILITGAAGFLGSAITAALAKSHQVIAVDFRDPGNVLKARTPDVCWELCDISDADAVARVFDAAVKRYDKVDFVIHFAAFWHFDADMPPDYQKTNIEGTANIIAACRKNGCQRFIFASTLSVLAQTAERETLTETSSTETTIPYALSKIENEKMLKQASSDFPVAILRIGAVFSQWCELPPLYSLFQHWSQWGPVGRTVPGKGMTGFPFLHRDDLVRLVISIVEKNDRLGRCEWFLPCGTETVTHADLYPVLRKALGRSGDQAPIYLPVPLVRVVLILKSWLGKLTGHMPDERPWMMDYADKPWKVDNSTTREVLDWEPNPENDILASVPRLAHKFTNQREAWERRKIRRNSRRFLDE
jgi:nucleoside-diphosphate-sugar epimerase